MSEVMERPPEEQLAEVAAKLAVLEEAAWALLVALESYPQDQEKVLKAKRELANVFLNHL
jgi:hypothetical protein